MNVSLHSLAEKLIGQKDVVERTAVLLRIHEVPSQISAVRLAILTYIYRGVLQFLQTNV
jgi:hypothetical protein